jgi:hypothetical protein
LERRAARYCTGLAFPRHWQVPSMEAGWSGTKRRGGCTG